MPYLLDASTLAETLRAAPNSSLVRRLSQVPPRDRWTSALVATRLLVLAREDRSVRVMRDVVRLVAAVRVASFDLAAAEAHARLVAHGASAPTPEEAMTAAIAVAREFVLVTRHPERFLGFEGLRLEDWTG